MKPSIKIVLVDDHGLLRQGLAGLLEGLGYEVLYGCNNGKELTTWLEKGPVPDIVLMDVSMPEMDGYDTTLWLRKNHPDVQVLALSMNDDEHAIIHMLRSGAKGYIMKDAEPAELRRGIEDVMSKGIHYSDRVTGKLLHSIHQVEDYSKGAPNALTNLNDREIEFLKLVGTEMTYKEIAESMHLSPRTIDGYRDALFEKLQVKNRIGLALFAIKNNIIRI